MAQGLRDGPVLVGGWLLGFGSPLWPFPYNGGSSRFLEQFGTFQFVTKEFASTLQTGKRKLIPSVSNLGRMWRLLSPFAVRRLKEDFLKDLPPKYRDVHWVPLTSPHASIYRRVEEAMQDTLKRELDKEDPNMGVISMALWWGRYAASCPTEEGAPHYAGAFGSRINVDEATPQEIKAVVDQLKLQRAVLPKNVGFNKVDKAMTNPRHLCQRGESHRLHLVARRAGRGARKRIGYTGMDGVPTQAQRRRPELEALATPSRWQARARWGVTINGANRHHPEHRMGQPRCKPKTAVTGWADQARPRPPFSRSTRWKNRCGNCSTRRRRPNAPSSTGGVVQVRRGGEAVARMQVAKAVIEIERKPSATSAISSQLPASNVEHPTSTIQHQLPATSIQLRESAQPNSR